MTTPTAEAASGRPSINSRTRRKKVARLIERDGNRCFYCDTAFTDDVPPTLDHVMPVLVRRTWANEALVLACEPCNTGKGHLKPHQVMRMVGQQGLTSRGSLRLDPETLRTVFQSVRGQFQPGFQPAA